MSNQIARSSYNDEAMVDFATDCRDLLQGQITTGRVFWLRGISITNTDGVNAADVYIYDYATEGASPAVTTQRLEVTVPITSTVKMAFAAPGIKFASGMLGALAVAATGTIGAYGINVWGYEE